MISGNRRIPLVYSNEKDKDPTYFKYVPGNLRVIKFGCVCPPPPPDVCTPPTSVDFQIVDSNFLSITFPSGNLIAEYSADLFNVTDNVVAVNNILSGITTGGTYLAINNLTSGKMYKIKLYTTDFSPNCNFTVESNIVTAP
jgi:hypothetical protein